MTDDTDAAIIYSEPLSTKDTFQQFILEQQQVVTEGTALFNVCINKLDGDDTSEMTKKRWDDDENENIDKVPAGNGTSSEKRWEVSEDGFVEEPKILGKRGRSQGMDYDNPNVKRKKANPIISVPKPDAEPTHSILKSRNHMQSISQEVCL
jgi:hypothetical protein